MRKISVRFNHPTIFFNLIYWILFSHLVLVPNILNSQSQDIKFEHITQEQGLSTDLVTSSILQDRKGFIWFGNSEGLNNYDGYRFTVYKHEADDPNSLSNTNIHAILEDSEKPGILWIGTDNGGLNRFDTQTEIYTHFLHDPENPNSISHNWIASIYEDHSGKPWIGTGEDLDRFDIQKETFAHYTQKDGLLSNFIIDMIADDEKYLWIHTRKGISKLNIESETFKNYDVHDGLQVSLYAPQELCLSKSTGEIFICGREGFYVFHPESLKTSAEIPPVVLTDFQIYNKPVAIGEPDSPLKKSIANTDELVLDHDQNAISFEFAALHYTAPEKHQYAYKMEGIDPDWVHTDASRRYARYTQMSPGDYVFRVRGTNNDGVWNEEGTSIRITITPPFWQTWWAYALYVLIFLSLIYFIRRYELNRQRLKHNYKLERFEGEKFKEVDSMKSRFFANISHEFRTPLMLIQGSIEKWLQKYKDEELRNDFVIAKKNSFRLLRLINQLLDLSKLESGKMRLQAKYADIVSILRGLIQSFESLVKQKNIDLRFHSKETEIFLYFDQDKIEKIMTNLLSNAFKFTPEGGEIEVAVLILHPPHSPRLDAGRAFTKGEADSPLSSVENQPTGGDLGGCIQISVSNTGPGITSDRLDKIFDRFYQVDDSFTREQEGSGIGLALTKELVELHQGEITVASEPVEGTTFTLRLLLGKDHLTANQIVPEPVGQPIKSQIPDQVPLEESDQQLSKSRPMQNTHLKNSPVLLIVEDNQDMRHYIRSHLDQDYRIIEAQDGREGLKKAFDKMPNLIISDVMMPKMDGVELCNKLKTDTRTSHIPIILLTARADQEAKLEGLETGADDYLTKPFNAKELRVRVENLIKLRRKLRKRFQKEFSLQPKDIAVTPVDERFLNSVMEIIEEHMSDMEFNVQKFSREIGMSRTNLNRKLTALTDHSAGQFIRTMRLRRAASLITQNYGPFTQIAYKVGFNNLSYFAECFRKQFGKTPSRYPEISSETEFSTVV